MTTSVRKPWLALASGVAVVTLVALAWLAVRGGDGAGVEAGAPSSATASETLELDPQAETALIGITTDFNSVNADSPPTSIEVVATTRYAAIEVTQAASEISQEDGDVFLIVEQGDFTLHSASVPPGADTPAGPLVYMIVDATTMHVDSWGQLPSPVDLSALGPTFDLT